jgi:hypothetical protein
MRPPRIVPLRGLSRQLEQSLRVFQRGLRSANRRLEGRAEKRAFLRECGFKRRLAALGSESVYETSTSMRPGWLAWAAFIFAWKSNSLRISRVKTDLGTTQCNSYCDLRTPQLPSSYIRPYYILKIILRFPKILRRIHNRDLVNTDLNTFGCKREYGAANQQTRKARKTRE